MQMMGDRVSHGERASSIGRHHVAMFYILDDDHQQLLGEYTSLDFALAELNRLAGTPYDEDPNRAPCTSWAGCGRAWTLYDDRISLGVDLRVVATLTTSRSGYGWSVGPDAIPTEVDAIGPRARSRRAQRMRLSAKHRSPDRGPG